jgi:hypothetical protein
VATTAALLIEEVPVVRAVNPLTINMLENSFDDDARRYTQTVKRKLGVVFWIMVICRRKAMILLEIFDSCGR